MMRSVGNLLGGGRAFHVPAPSALGVSQQKRCRCSATHSSSPSSYNTLLRLWYESKLSTSPCHRKTLQLITIFPPEKVQKEQEVDILGIDTLHR
jgi:hypothetical protein